jgi:hypothetical protein
MLVSTSNTGSIKPIIPGSITPIRDTPSIARLETGKVECRRWCDEVITALARESEKFLGYLHADDVQPQIFGAGVTAPVAVEPGAG